METSEDSVVTKLMGAWGEGARHEIAPPSFSPVVLEMSALRVSAPAIAYLDAGLGAPVRSRRAAAIRVMGLISLGILLGGAIGVGGTFLSPFRATTRAPVAAAAAPKVESPAPPLSVPRPALDVTANAHADLVAETKPAAKRAIAGVVRKAKSPSSAKASIAVAVDADRPAVTGDSSKAAVAEAQALEKAQLDALMR